MLLRVFFSIFIVLFTGGKMNQVYAQLDTSFWFAPPEVSQDAFMDRPIMLRISTLSQSATVTISIPANPGFIPITVNVASASTASIDLTPWINIIETRPPNTILNTGLKISSSSRINVYYEVVSGGYNQSCQCNPEIFALKGKSSLGKNFIIPSQNILMNWAYNPPSTHSFDVVAIENNTNVTITPSKNIIGHPAGIPFIITLNTGQVFSSTAANQLGVNHLGGSTITSDKNIAITLKDDGLYNIACWDMGGDQLIPVDNLSTEYIAVQGYLTSGFTVDKVFVTALNNNTTVSVGGVIAGTVNAGQTLVLPFTSISMYISANNKIYAFQISGSGCEVGLSSLPSISACRGSSEVSFTRSSSAQLTFLVITRVANQSFFLINGAPVNISNFNFVPGTANQWVYARIDIPVSQVPVLGSARISNTNGLFHLGVIHGDGPSGGARFGYFSDFSLPVLNVFEDSTRICQSSVVLDAGAGYTSYNWNTGATSQTITATQNGSYKVTVANVDGCVLSDSSYIKLQPAIRDSSVANICSGQVYTLPWGNMVNSPGIYRDTLHYTAGCDSVIRIVDLKSQAAIHINTSAVICSGQNYILPWGLFVNSTGIYRDTLKYVSGCDSLIHRVDLIVQSANHNFITASVCTGQYYTLPSGRKVNGAGIYIDTLRSQLAGCDSIITTLDLDTNLKPVILLEKSNDVSCSIGTTQLNASGGVSYQWTPANSLDNAFVSNPVASPSATTIYSVKVTSANGCVGKDSLKVYVNGNLTGNEFKLPNAFTPNNDGLNDCFGLRNWGYVPEANLSIYNRWGGIVFNSNDPKACWNGTFNGVMQPTGVYVYQVTAETICGPVYKKGTVILIR